MTSYVFPKESAALAKAEMAQAAACGFCERPIRLFGINSGTGEVRSILTRCKARRESQCAGCGSLYRSACAKIIESGFDGHEASMFAWVTLTPPGAGVFGSACHIAAAVGKCPCGARHRSGDPLVGSPRSPSRFRYDRAARWNYILPRLWTRTVERLRERLDSPEQRVEYVKIVEYQLRGLGHIHALVRIPRQPTKRAAEALVRSALGSVSSDGWRWGRQMSVEIIDGTRSDTLAAKRKYLAKYASKDLFAGNLESSSRARARHYFAIMNAAGELATALKLGGRVFGRTVRQLGMRGCPLTKSHGYGDSFKKLREQAAEAYGHATSEWSWQYEGRGYLTAAAGALVQRIVRSRGSTGPPIEP